MKSGRPGSLADVFKRLDERFLRRLFAQKKTLITGLFCAGVASMLELVGTVAILKMVGDALEARDSSRLAILCGSVIGVFLLKYFFTFGQVYYLSKAAQRVAANLRRELFEKLHDLPIAFFNARQVGALQSVLTNDVTVIQLGVPMVRDVVDAPIKVVLGVVALLILSWKLALLSIIALPPVALLIQYNSVRVKKAQAQVQEDMANMQSVLQESLHAVRVIKAFNAEERETARFGERVERTFASAVKLVRRMAVLKPRIELIGACALALVCWVGGMLVVRGELTVASLLAFGFALDKIVNGAKGVGVISQVYNQVTAAMGRIHSLVLDVPNESHETSGKQIIEKPTGRIEFKEVSFSYPDGTVALKRVSFVIEAGESAALVGRSGAGKSTIADLLLRFYDPCEGLITFDNVDIRELDINWYRRQIGVVPQQNMLFAATLAENIALGKPDAPIAEIERASHLAHADEFINSMPEKYDSLIGEKGTRLSGGEVQRVAIARALLINPTVLLLDEATSALDAMSEQKVQEALDEVMTRRTTLLIAHRLSTAARANKIIVLAHGELIEQGSHSELLSQNGSYASMVRAFSAGFIDETIG